MRGSAVIATIALGVLPGGCTLSFALNPSLDVSQYAHTVWTARDGFFKGNIYSIAQTSDGYLWLGTEFGLFRFDGVNGQAWQPPAGQRLPDKNINALLGARDGTLWIGTFAGLASWSGGKLTSYPELDRRFVESLVEDRDGTVWAGALFSPNAGPTGLLCALRNGRTQCYGKDGTLGIAVPGLHEDKSGTLWVLAQSGLWGWKPGPQRRYSTTPVEVTDLSRTEEGEPLFAVRGGGLMHLVGDKSEPYPIRDPGPAKRMLSDREVDANKLLRDHDGGLWIGTVERGLIHVHNGRTDVFAQSNGLSGDVVLSLFEDHEGNVWVATTGGLDRFRELPVTTVSAKQGLSSDASQSVLAATDGSIWIGSHDGLTRLKNGQITIFGRSSGLPDDEVQSLYQDISGRVWAATDYGLAFFKDGRFVAVNAMASRERHFLHFITGDNAGNLWISEHENLLHLLDGHLVEKIPWPELGHRESAEVLLSGGERGGVWLGFWSGGGLSYFKDGRVRVAHTNADGLGDGHVADLELDQDGALWAATQDGGVSRIKDGRITTLTTRNGLPCDTIHWTMVDDDGSFWLYTACGLIRITRPALDAWIREPKRTIETTVWDAADGVRPRSSAASTFGPRVTKSPDGRLWFLTGVGVQVVDPHHLPFNRIPPPVHIEQIVADRRSYWENSTGAAVAQVHLPPLIHDLMIDYTALSLVAPGKVHFRYKLEGQDPDWREVVNDRAVQYSNLRPGSYRFRVMASNNSGVWNEAGDTLEFSIAPAYYQSNWFKAICVAALLLILWGLYRLRLYQIAREFDAQLEGRVGERLRVARELHDTLLQSFQASLIQMQAARDLFSRRPEQAAENLDDAITMAAGAITEGRDAIQELRSQPQDRGDLEQLFNVTGQDLSRSQESKERPASFRVVVEGEQRPLKPLLQDEIYRIARELLRNAFRHAQAGQIEAEIRYEPRQLCVHVRDDGKGIDPQILKAGGRDGHWGLAGMRERAKRIGARLDFWSETGAGTEVRLTVPSSIAYQADHKERWLGLLGRKRASS